MISFKEFLTEIFDKPYSFYKEDPVEHGYHRYNFRTENNTRYRVVIDQDDVPHDISFYEKVPDKDRPNHFMDKASNTSSQGNQASKVFSTIHHIIKQHIENHHPDTSYQFSASSHIANKAKLYRHMINKYTHQHDEKRNAFGTIFTFKKKDIK